MTPFSSSEACLYWNRVGIFFPYESTETNRLNSVTSISEGLVLSLDYAARDRNFLACLKTWIKFNSSYEPLCLPGYSLQSLKPHELVILLFLLESHSVAGVGEAIAVAKHELKKMDVKPSFSHLVGVSFIHFLSSHLPTFLPGRRLIRERLLSLEIRWNQRVFTEEVASRHARTALLCDLDPFFKRFGLAVARIVDMPHKVAQRAEKYPTM